MKTRWPAARWQAGLSHAEAITSLGESLSETALLYRAGLSGQGPSDFLDGAGDRIQLCASPALPGDLPARERMLTLAAHALTGVERRLRAAGAGQPDLPPVLVLCLPASLGMGDQRFELNPAGVVFVEALRALLPPRWRGAVVDVFPFGRAAGAMAMARALQLADGPRDVIWGGVDSLIDWPVLETLIVQERLRTREHVAGVCPGEAAAFAVVSPSDRGQALLLGLGVGHEPEPPAADAPPLEGFSRALAAAVEPLRHAALRSDLWWLGVGHDGEADQEADLLLTRFRDVLGPRCQLRSTLAALGDVGAAALPLLVALAMQDWAEGQGDDDLAVLVAGSDEGARGAMLLATPVRALDSPWGGDGSVGGGAGGGMGGIGDHR